MDPYSAVIAVVLMVASYLITSSMITKPEPVKPNTIDDFDFPTFEEGTPQAVVFGDCWTADWMVLAYGDFRVDAIKGKGGKK
jgi:hypothetical protein